MEKLRHTGIPLAEFIGSSPAYGLKTSLNTAFLVDTPTRERLIQADPNCATIIQPYLRGQDIKRWTPEWAGLWMVLLKSSDNYTRPWAGRYVKYCAKLWATGLPGWYRDFSKI
jgi:hypothetical protein